MSQVGSNPPVEQTDPTLCNVTNFKTDYNVGYVSDGRLGAA